MVFTIREYIKEGKSEMSILRHEWWMITSEFRVEFLDRDI